MAFHVACPITCRRICFCSLGFPRNLQRESAKNSLLEEVIRVEDFFKDPWGVRVSKEETVQVSVPKVEPVRIQIGDGVVGVGGGDAVDEAAALSSQAKRLALQRRAAAAMVAAEDFARKVEAGDIAAAPQNLNGGDLVNTNALCRMCFLSENEGSERARKMLSCRSCDKKYHRSCLKSWSQNRDLFHWSSWTCPYCRTCEVCRSTGDPTRIMFCKRCDGAHHCYCQHPSHKNVTPGPYLCPKHTRCHSCESSVPGNGLSVRWFLGYTCCDACGRLFVKGNYCPVCLKVYRDSESTPMVCCDVCQRWVHCHCDGISDEKYLQFQVDGNLQYKCATCRGECYQVKDLEDAVRELWRRRDKADQDVIASLRAAAGLPTQEEIFSIYPYSDDEENGPALSKNGFGRSIKFSLKGIVDSPKKAKEHGKKSKKHSKKKACQASLTSKADQSFEEDNDAQFQGYSLGDDKNNEILPRRSESRDISSVAGVCSTNQLGFLKHKLMNEVMVSDEDRISRFVKLKSNKPTTLDSGGDDGKHDGNSKILKAKKLVINLGARKINVTNSPKSDSSSFQKGEEMIMSNGQQKMDDHHMLRKHDRTAKFVDVEKADQSDQTKGSKVTGKERISSKFGKIRSEIPQLNPKDDRGNDSDGRANASLEQSSVASGKRNIEGSRVTAGSMGEVPPSRAGKIILRKHVDARPDVHGESKEDSDHTPVSSSVSKDSKPPLKFKFKKPSVENQQSQVPQNEEEKILVKGQRSKRKRPSPFIEKSSFNGDEDADVTLLNQDSSMDGMMDASWILKKLGRDAIGKRVEVHQTSDNSWHKGDVTDVIEETSTLSVKLDDGRVKSVELGKQGVRFVLQKQKRSKT